MFKICIYRFLEIKIFRMSRQESVNIALEPDNKENAWNNIFNLITVLWLLGYIGYQFYIEWSNWEAYESQFNNTWRISVVDAVEAQTMRLTRICKNEQIFEQVFFWVLGANFIYSFLKFVCRQYNIISQSLRCETGVQWFLSLLLYAFLLAVQSTAGFFYLTLMLPSTFMQCYDQIAKFYCTILFGSLIGIMFLSLTIAILGKPILNYKIKYTNLVKTDTGDIEITNKKGMSKSSRFKAYRDKKEEEVKIFVDNDSKSESDN